MTSLKEVDWSKAPEGATHYNGALGYPWLMGVPVSFYNGNNWVEYKSDDSLWEDHFFNAVKRLQEWDGSGVPPVGTVCEYRLNEYDIWCKCEIKYVLSGTNDCFVAWCDHLSTDQFLTFSSRHYRLQLRKIKTPEQIAEEERLCAIEEMVCLSHLAGSSVKDVMEALYDAGYRKTEVKK